MKRLKLFKEAFKQEYYYQEITKEEFRNMLLSPIRMEEKNIEKLKSLFDSNIWVLPNCKINNLYYTLIQQSTMEYFYSSFEIRIFVLNDEWYYVDWNNKKEKSMGEYVKIIHENTYYKCDQFDGLLRFLTDKKDRREIWG